VGCAGAFTRCAARASARRPVPLMGSAGSGCASGSYACGTGIADADGAVVEPTHSGLGRSQARRCGSGRTRLDRLGNPFSRRRRATAHCRAVMGNPRRAAGVEADARLERARRSGVGHAKDRRARRSRSALLVGARSASCTASG
jgi:hypothetical protein